MMIKVKPNWPFVVTMNFEPRFTCSCNCPDQKLFNEFFHFRLCLLFVHIYLWMTTPMTGKKAQQLRITTRWWSDEIEILDKISRNYVAFCRSVVAFSGFESLSMHNFVYYFHIFTHTDGSQHLEIDIHTRSLTHTHTHSVQSEVTKPLTKNSQETKKWNEREKKAELNDSGTRTKRSMMNDLQTKWKRKKSFLFQSITYHKTRKWFHNYLLIKTDRLWGCLLMSVWICGSKSLKTSNRRVYVWFFFYFYIFFLDFCADVIYLLKYVCV